MNNIIQRKIIVTGSYQPLVGSPLIGSVTISALPGNAGEVFFRGDDGGDVPCQPGEWHCFRSVDLSQIFVKGTPGDVITVIGGTWD